MPEQEHEVLTLLIKKSAYTYRNMLWYPPLEFVQQAAAQIPRQYKSK